MGYRCLLGGICLLFFVNRAGGVELTAQGTATVRAVSETGSPLASYDVRLIAIKGEHDNSAPAYATGRLSRPAETGRLATPMVHVENEDGVVHFPRLAPGHYQVFAMADRYRMQLSDAGYSQVHLPEGDAREILGRDLIPTNGERPPVVLNTRHFEVLADETAEVTITMLPTWTLHGSVELRDAARLTTDEYAERLRRVRARYDGPLGNAPFRIGPDGGYTVESTGAGELKISLGKPIGAGNDVPWEQVISVSVKPHEVYVLPSTEINLPED